ncbi:MAG: MarR family transcriptional regulator [Blautia sp.]|nr:MarR family transcriptional regulator [Blautia sp.]
MDEINELTRENVSSDIRVLSHEITYRRYLMNKGKIKELFEKLSIPEYIALYNIDMERELSSIYGEKTYLKDLSEKMELSMRQTSRMIGNLRDRGLLLWSHDGNGSEGTYVIITDSGKKLLKEQEEILRKFYGNVIDKFGKEKLIQLLQLMKELETIMSSEFEDMEEEDGEEII